MIGDTDDIKEFQRKKEEFLNESNVGRKRELKEEVENLLVGIFRKMLKKDKANYFRMLEEVEGKYAALPDKRQKEEAIQREKEKLHREFGFNLETVEEQLRELSGDREIKPFFLWNLYFSEVMYERGGFDVVIGNPPYIQLQKLRGDPLQKAYRDQNYKVFASTGDIYCLFYENGLNLLRRNGRLCFITSNKWMRAGYGEPLRAFLLEHNPEILVDLGPGVFESATVDTNILLVEKAENKQRTLCGTIHRENNRIPDIANYLERKGNSVPGFPKGAWFIGTRAETALKEKIEKRGKALKDWDVKIYRGVLTGFNEAFIIDTATKERLCGEDPKSAEIIKPVLRGRDIGRYGYKWRGLWVIATFPALGLNIDDYTAVKEYLLSFGKERLEQSGKELSKGKRARKKTGNKWFETQDQIAYHPEFEKEKVVWKEMSQWPAFSYDRKGIYCNDTGRILTGKHIKFFIGLFNTLFFEFAFSSYYSGGGLGKKGVRYKSEFMKEFPIPPITKENRPTVNTIERLVEKILSAKKDGLQDAADKLERRIDQLVYQLYDLTDEEIKIVEEGRK